MKQIFSDYIDCPIALYGLGIETEKVLSILEGTFHIVGLLDSFRQEGAIFGKRIISFGECVQQGVKLIIVVARPGSCRAIAKKIGTCCAAHQIQLMDARGRDLCIIKQGVYRFARQGITREQLAGLADGKDTVSFDLFDTLVMRQVLFPSDVIELTENRIRKKGIYIENFLQKRQQAEKELSKDRAPSLLDIYQLVLEQSSDVLASAGELAQMEWETDFGLVIPRQEMVDFAVEIYRNGKPVYITTDTYYSRNQIEQMLAKCSITCYTDILVSCEYKTGKTQKLFCHLKNILQENTCVHIGDDLAADVESASRCGILGCQIYSGIDLFEMTGYLGMWEYAENLSSRIKLGMFVARLFNSPFQFETQNMQLSVCSAYDVGYLFMAPVITDFVLWFREQVLKKNIKNVWFCARDGYLIKKLYDMLCKDGLSVYFLSSRVAAIRAGIEDEADIAYVDTMKFGGTLSRQLRERFGIDVNEEALTGKRLIDFSQDIIEKAKENKRCYQKYIDSIATESGDIAFFDFVAKGTCQMYINRLVDHRLKGLYFLQIEKAFMKEKELDITAFYDEDELRENAIYEDYYILETVLTSPQPSIVGFYEDGTPCYTCETRTPQELRCVEKMQAGITDYFQIYCSLCAEGETETDQKLDETLLNQIHHIKIWDEDFWALKVEDAFFNRMTDMSDLV